MAMSPARSLPSLKQAPCLEFSPGPGSVPVQRQLSQEELAVIANPNRSYVGVIEREEKPPTVDTIERLAEALDAPVGDLLICRSNR
jgi:DNA-binding XRE family transcriptional regulator